MVKDEYNPGPRLTAKEIEDLIKDMYVGGSSPMENFGITWADTEALSKKLEVHSVEIDVAERTLTLHISNEPRLIPFSTTFIYPEEDGDADLPET